MRILKKCLIAMVFTTSLLTFTLPAISGTTDVPKTLNYQGNLTDSTGQPVTGSHQIIFNLYTAASGGTAFWTETQNIQVAEGKFSAILGKTTPIDTAQFTGNTYLGIRVDGGTEMVPRQQFTSVAYALKAGSIFNMPETIPRGVVVMWTGAVNEVPSGWALCDGTNGTPDLRKKFIIGADSEYLANTTGGNKTHTVSVGEMPSHTHIQNAHNHTEAGHTHNVVGSCGTNQNLSAGALGSYTGYMMGGNNDRYPTVAGYSNIQNTTPINQNTGGGAAFEIIPPYYALAFIMKL